MPNFNGQHGRQDVIVEHGRQDQSLFLYKPVPIQYVEIFVYLYENKEM